MFPNALLGSISSFNLGDIIGDVLENGGGLLGGNVADLIGSVLENGGGLQGGNLGDVIGGLLGGVSALHPQLPFGK